MRGRTTFVIAHRLSTIESADEIVVMEQGRIVEQGNHKTLLDKSGHYARLHRMQFHDGMDANLLSDGPTIDGSTDAVTS